MLSTLGFIALVIGVVLVILGYTVEARALRPGWGLVILAVVLIVLGYLLPTLASYPATHAMGLLPVYLKHALTC